MTGKRIFTVETLSSAIILLWGLSIADPYSDAFLRVPELYAPMISIVPSETFWGLTYMVLGLFSLLLSYYEAVGKKSYISSSLFNVFIYASITMLFFIGDKTTTNWRLWCLIILWNFIHWKWRS